VYTYTDYCVCPTCYDVLRQEEDVLICQACAETYSIQNNIPILLPKYRQEQEQEYFDNYQNIAQDDLHEPLETNRSYRHQVMLDFIGRSSLHGKRVLDIGSSNAQYLQVIDAEFKVAFDIALFYLDAVLAESGVVSICGDAERLPFQPGFFDVIIISDILEHLLHPGKLVERLSNICTAETRIIVHIPWDEHIAVYADSSYQFTHLRTFNTYNYAELWRNFYIRRTQATYPNLQTPLTFAIAEKLPLFFYNLISDFYFRFPALSQQDYKWREKRITKPQGGEWWQLWLFKPVFKMFEMRLGPSPQWFRLTRALRLLEKLMKWAKAHL
jgi:uncharacterized protein YbaR (Trm112 family)